MDTFKDKQLLEDLYTRGQVPWEVWKRTASRGRRSALSMQRVSLLAGSALRRVLALGAHADDIEIGCGGTLLRLLAERPRARGALGGVLLHPGAGGGGARLGRRVPRGRVDARGGHRRAFRDGFLPTSGAAVKDEFEELKGQFSPDLIFTHFRDDRHQDHRLVSELTWNTWRDHLILEYEIPKYDGDLGAPNFFVAARRADAWKRKIALVLKALPHPGRQAVVHGRPLPRGGAHPRDGMRGARRAGRGILLPEGRLLAGC